MAIPELERHCGSWIIAKDGKAVCETFDRANAEYAAENGYDVLTASQWLGSLNSAPVHGSSAIRSESPETCCPEPERTSADQSANGGAA